jgi:hypothetical protein
MRTRWRHKALLGKGYGDGAKAAAIIQLVGSSNYFWAHLGKVLSAFALGPAVKREALAFGGLAFASTAKLGDNVGFQARPEVGGLARNEAGRRMQGL